MANTHMCTAEWGKVLTDRLLILELWAERQGLELAADCHLAKINQCAQFLQVYYIKTFFYKSAIK